jgi:hypothetical protein
MESIRFITHRIGLLTDRSTRLTNLETVLLEAHLPYSLRPWRDGVLELVRGPNIDLQTVIMCLEQLESELPRLVCEARDLYVRQRETTVRRSEFSSPISLHVALETFLREEHLQLEQINRRLGLSKEKG